MQTDITKVNGQLVKEVSKIIKDELATAGLHLLELKKALAMVKHGTFVTDTAIKIKEAYSKASKELNAPSTYKKYSMRWGRLVSVEKRNDIKVSLGDVADINSLNMAEIDILLGGTSSNRGGGRKSSVTEPKEVIEEPEVSENAQGATEEPKIPVISVKKAKESILNSLSNLLTMDSDSIAFKVSKLSPVDLSNLANALKLLD